MNRKLAIAATVLLAAGSLSGCAQKATPSSAASATPNGSPSTITMTTPATTMALEDATASAKKIQDQVASVTKVVTITEDNDPNNEIGRPGGYTSAAVIYENSVECVGKDVRVDCGAKIEVFESPADAKARAAYIQGLTKSMPIIGKEYNYLRGVALLRVAGDVKPSVAKKYHAAFGGDLMK